MSGDFVEGFRDVGGDQVGPVDIRSLAVTASVRVEAPVVEGLDYGGRGLENDAVVAGLLAGVVRLETTVHFGAESVCCILGSSIIAAYLV